MRKYILNPETLLYELKEVSLKHKLFKGLLLFAGSILMAVFYVWLCVSVLKIDLPKTAFLKAKRARWESRIEILNSRLDHYDAALDAFEIRDEDIYRSVFGMNSIPSEVRDAGIGGSERYAALDGLEADNKLKNTAVRLDYIARKAYVQTQSFDEVASCSKNAGDMVSCIPAVPPIIPDPAKYNLTSRFGQRTDPFDKSSKMHTGVDLAMKVGNPVYVTGDGVVESIDFDIFGYGNCIVVDHGFGYKTKYAHLSMVKVVEGMKLKRGDEIGEVGSSGRSTGPHLHYEVIYRGDKVNPENYFDLSMPKDEYVSMVESRAEESGRGKPEFGFSVRHRKKQQS